MCRRSRRSAPMPTPAPIQPRIQNQLAQSERVSRLPRERDLLDPDEVSGVEYGPVKRKQEQLELRNLVRLH